MLKNFSSTKLEQKLHSTPLKYSSREVDPPPTNTTPSQEFKIISNNMGLFFGHLQQPEIFLT